MDNDSLHGQHSSAPPRSSMSSHFRVAGGIQMDGGHEGKSKEKKFQRILHERKQQLEGMRAYVLTKICVGIGRKYNINCAWLSLQSCHLFNPPSRTSCSQSEGQRSS